MFSDLKNVYENVDVNQTKKKIEEWLFKLAELMQNDNNYDNSLDETNQYFTERCGKAYEEQRSVLKNYIKEKYFSGKDGMRLVVLTIVLTILLIITLDAPMHWIAIKTHLPIVLLTILNMVISFMVAIRVVATVEMYSRGINKSAYPTSLVDVPKDVIVVSPWDKETIFEKFVEYNVIGVKKVDDNTFNVLVTEKDGGEL